MEKNDDYNVEIGQSLEPEAWFACRDQMRDAFPLMAQVLTKFGVFDQQAVDEWLAAGHLVIQALDYVGNFAADKCRFIVLPEKDT